MRKLHSTLALALLALGSITTACGSDDDDSSSGNNSGAVFSCTAASGNGCVEYSGSGAPVETLRSSCTQGGDMPGTACSHEGLSGVCTIAAGPASIRRYHYDLDADATTQAKQVCEASGGGVWSES